jgi:adenosylhomocysteine nucleosidase
LGNVILAACGLQREAQIVARAGLVPVVGGGDVARLEAALEARAQEVRAILSIGICGALSPALDISDIVVGGGATDLAWRAVLAAHFPNAHIGLVHGQDMMLATAADKARVHAETGAIAVDMESQVAARVAARHGLPFAILRVVSDRADQTLPPAARVGINPDGSMAFGKVLGALVANPGQVPALIMTAARAERAFRTLIDVCDVLARLGVFGPDFGERALDMR